MQDRIYEYLSSRYKVTQGMIRPRTGQGSASANLNPRSDILIPLTEVITEAGELPPNTVVGYIEQWRDQYEEQGINPARTTARILNPYDEFTDNDRLLFKSFRWFLKGGKQNIVMLGSSKNTWIMLDPTTKLFPNICSYPKRQAKIAQQYRDILVRAYENNTYARLLAWDSATTSSENGLNYPSYSLAEYYEKSKDVFLGDITFKIDEPKLISDDPEEHAYMHVPAITEGECPILDAWTALRFRTEDDRNVFRAYLCSVFDPVNDSRQALWIHDIGQTGKSTVLNAVSKSLGLETCATLNTSNITNPQFTGSLVYGKRLVTIGDNKNSRLIQSGIVHNILGGDIMNIEFKGSTAFPARISCRMIIGANCKPDIDATVAHERSRVLILELRSNNELTDEEKKSYIYGGHEQELTDKIAKEIIPFIHKYWDVYTQLAPTNGNLVLSEEQSDRMYSTVTTEETINFDYIAERYLEVTGNPDDCVPAVIMQNLVKKVYPKGGNDFVVSGFKKHLLTAFNLNMSRPRKDGVRLPQGYYGVKMNMEAFAAIRNIDANPILGDWLAEQEAQGE